MCRCRAFAAFLCLALLTPPAPPAFAQEKSPDAQKVEQLTAEVERLKGQVEALMAENASLKEKLAAAEAKRPAGAGGEVPATNFELGPEAKLGPYAYKTPVDWITQGVKNNPNAAVFRSADKQAVILVNLKLKGAVPPEVAPQYAQKVITQLKQDFAKNKTEVIDPPVSVPDTRFFLKVHERIKIKEKTADQTHLYLMPNKDLVELTVITTAEPPDQVSQTVKLAEDMVLSFKIAK
jgi:hypothetical protein